MSDISIKGQSPILKYSKKAFLNKFVTRLAGGVEGKPHTSKEGIHAAAARKIDREVKKIEKEKAEKQKVKRQGRRDQ